MSQWNPYDELNIDPSADRDAILKAFKIRAKATHPDRKQGNKDRFTRVTRAKDLLMNAKTRKLYDRFGVIADEPRSAAGETTTGANAASSLFDFMFAAAHQSRGPNFSNATGWNPPPQFAESAPSFATAAPTSNPVDAVAEIRLTLAEAYRGKSCKLKICKRVVCDECRGTGQETMGSSIGVDWCVACSGTGLAQAVRCSRCNGTGSIRSRHSACRKCRGQRTTRKSETISVSAPPGVRTGQKIILHHEGDTVPGNPPGNVVVRFVVDEFDETLRLQRVAQHLLYVHDLDVCDVLEGTVIVVRRPTEPETAIRLHVAARELQTCFSRCILRVSGEGMPGFPVPGDLWVECRLRWNESAPLNIAERKWLRERLGWPRDLDPLALADDDDAVIDVRHTVLTPETTEPCGETDRSHTNVEQCCVS